MIDRRVAILRRCWHRITDFGVTPRLDPIEKKYAHITNQVMAVIGFTMIAFIGILAFAGLYRAVLFPLSILALIAIGLMLIYRGHLLISRIFCVGVGMTLVFIGSIFIGGDSALIEFSILVVLVSVIIFELRHIYIILSLILYSLVLYLIYHTWHPLLAAYNLPLEQQLRFNLIAIPIRYALILGLILVVVKRNSDTEKAIENQKNYYLRILDHVPINIVMFNANLEYTFVNKYAVKDPAMRQWLIGKTDLEYTQYRKLDPSISAGRMRLIRDAFEGRDFYELEEDMINHRGDRVCSVKGAIPIPSSSGDSIKEVVTYSLDITRRKAAEEQLKATVTKLETINTELKQFGYVVSHDLKTPLRNISTYLQILKRKNQLNEESNELIEDAVKSVKHLHQLINDIFLYASSDQSTLATQEVNVKELIWAICDEMKDVISERRVSVSLDTALPSIIINPTHAHHLFSNFITNAIKYNDKPNPTVEIGYQKVNGTGRFSIRDNGIGIAPAYHNQIFELFKRLHTPQQYEGTGVGLSLCKKIVEMYQGTITLESTEGRGTCFYFSLPIAGDTH